MNAKKPEVPFRPVNPELAPLFAEALKNKLAPAKSTKISTHLAKSLIEDACGLGATDIHVEPHREGSRIRFRVDGTVRDIYHASTQDGRP
jgi:type II secretory ATPase GspE/PulE/Tfp pilus assembly ATPase PilB-like protein